MRTIKRIDWSETRRNENGPAETYFVIAERTADGGWIFSERSSWDVTWKDVPNTPDLIAKAESLE